MLYSHGLETISSACIQRAQGGQIREEFALAPEMAKDFRTMSIDFDPPEGISLRPAAASDYAFAEELYLSTTRPLLRALGDYDEAAAKTRLRMAFHRHPPLVICAGERDIGWLQVSIRPAAVHLHQIHLGAGYRNRGIGRSLIGDIMEAARRARLAVTLNVIRGNPAVDLYRQLDFSIVTRGTELLQMRWEPDGADGTNAAEPGPET